MFIIVLKTDSPYLNNLEIIYSKNLLKYIFAFSDILDKSCLIVLKISVFDKYDTKASKTPDKLS